jgi:hypothetical protein
MPKKVKKLPPQFPDYIYVYRDNPDEQETVLIADRNADDVANGERVAIYKLVEVRSKRVRHDLV